MPAFCRHNRFADRCPICREQSRTSPRAKQAPAPRRSAAGRARGRRVSAGVQVRREERAADDGYSHRLVPGLRASGDAARLAREIGFALARLQELAVSPPGLYADVATAPDVQRATWLAFAIAYAGPLDDDAGGDPFRSIRQSGLAATGGPDDPGIAAALAALRPGPRSSHDARSPGRVVAAFGAWTARMGGTHAAFTGDGGWSAQRRFERVYERLALGGLSRAARYDLLVTLGRLGVYEMRGSKLALGGDDRVTLASKRVFGIGDAINLERRAAALADAGGFAIEALDLALFNWDGGDGRCRGGASPGLEAEPQATARVAAAIGL